MFVCFFLSLFVFFCFCFHQIFWHVKSHTPLEKTRKNELIGDHFPSLPFLVI